MVSQTASSFQHCRLGANPALSELKEDLDHQLKSILSEILQLGRGHKYLSDQGFKPHPKHPLVLVLSSQKDKQNTLLPGFFLAGTKGFISWVLLHPLAELMSFAAM